MTADNGRGWNPEGVFIRGPQEFPSPRPMPAPILVSVAAPTGTAQSIALFVAPSALRTPISRVRSVTLIIMIATTPTPPTRRPNDDERAMQRMKTVPNSLL